MMKLVLKTVLLLFTALVVLAGCASSPQQASQDFQPQPSDPLLHNVLVAELAGHKGALATAVSYYRKVVAETEQIEILRRAVRIMLYAKDYMAASEAVGKWLVLAPEDMEAHQLSANVNLRIGNTEVVQTHLEWILQRAGNEQGYRIIATFLERLGQPQLAMDAMESLITSHPDNTRGLVAYARMAYDLKHYEKASKAAERAVRLSPDDTDAQLIRARTAVELGHAEQALEDLKAIVKKKPEARELRLSYARLLVTANRFESAVEQFEVLIEQVPDNADLIYSTALVLLQIKRYQDAEKYLIRLTGLPGHQQEALYYLGRLEEDRRRYDKAYQWYSKVDEGTLYLESQMSAARIQARLGMVDEAQEHFGQLRQSYPKLASKIWLGEGEMLSEVKSHQRAFEVLDSAVQAIPQDMDLLYSRALAAEKIDRIDILEQDLKQVLRNEPEHAHALNALGYTLADRTERYQEALQYIERALELEPTDPAILDSMGWVHYRLGDYDTALKFLQKAIASFHDGEIAAHLGEVLWVTGQQDRAKKVWDEALDVHPDSEVLLRAIRRFKP